eukprot:5519715-Pyramimonas_sp.AAC.2
MSWVPDSSLSDKHRVAWSHKGTGGEVPGLRDEMRRAHRRYNAKDWRLAPISRRFSPGGVD